MKEDSLVGQTLQHPDHDVIEQTQFLLMLDQLLLECDEIEYPFFIEILQLFEHY